MICTDNQCPVCSDHRRALDHVAVGWLRVTTFFLRMATMDRKPKFQEFAEVSLTHPVWTNDIFLPAGTRGVVMSTYADGLAYEVEFENPRHLVVTLEDADLSA